MALQCDFGACRTIGDTARMFKVSERTVSRWLEDPTFPGLAGERFKENGYFPINAIHGWLDAKASGGNMPDFIAIDQERLRGIELEIAEIEAAQVEWDLMTRKLLTEASDKIAKLLPPAVPKACRREVRALIKTELDSIHSYMAVAFRNFTS